MLTSPVRALLIAMTLSACSEAEFGSRSIPSEAETLDEEAGVQGGGDLGAENGGNAVMYDIEDGTIALPPPAEVAQLIEECRKSADKIQSLSRVLNYPERKNCSFGTAPNLERRQGFHQALETTPGLIELPPGTICDMNIRSAPNAALHYDDFLVLTLAQQVLFASNSTLSDRLTKQQDLYTWDPSRIIGQSIGDFESRPYCLGTAANCRLPGHDERGPVSLNLSSQEIAPIALLVSGKEKVALDLFASGDNDDEDCFHSAIELTVDLKYLPR